MTRLGLVGAGAMGSALGACWIAGGAEVVTCLDGRSDRTRAMAAAARLGNADDLDQLVARCDVVASVVPPASAVDVARDIAAAAARTGAQPLVVDLNAIAPATVRQVEEHIGQAGCRLVDGSISGGPPRPDAPATRVYVCGEDADRFAALPAPWLDVVRLDAPNGTASALKMCTASMYKGTKALVMQALLTADAHGVREEFLADTAREWPDAVPRWHLDVAVAATKAWRFVDEMQEIARTQSDVGLPAELFDGVAAAYTRAASTELGQSAPEDFDRASSVEDVVARLRDGSALPMT